MPLELLVVKDLGKVRWGTCMTVFMTDDCENR